MVDIRVDRVSKKYRIRQRANGARRAGSPPRRAWKFLGSRSEEFWALRDISFDVERGETLGIVGHNGAGKSTILKLLSNITAPTHGQITIHGRLSALIEVSSGFHPELTGRENIYLSGSILGMRRREISEKLPAIVDFAEVSRFLDTPIKHFSSGMHVRLGFSIAAHLDPDILLLDEVLAVGDLAFQAKCLRRIEEQKKQGKTIVFISHDLAAVERLSDRALLMQRGQLVSIGSPHEIVSSYQKIAASSVPEAPSLVDAGSRLAAITSFSFRNGGWDEPHDFHTGQPMVVRIGYVAHERVPDVTFDVHFFTQDHTLCSIFTSEEDGEHVTLEPGSGFLEFSCPELGLVPGIYYADVEIKPRGAPTGHNIHWLERCATLRVDPGKMSRGNFHMPHTWLFQPEGQSGSSAEQESIASQSCERLTNER
jgi:ABC-type polysaccharide/polyol phosphate transport system ATPase subunit